MELTLYKDGIVKVWLTPKGNKVVYARELFTALALKMKFNDWFKGKIKEHKLIINQDFCLLPVDQKQKKGRGGHNKEDYLIIFHSAKKIALGTNNKAGDEVKDYFIACEEFVEELKEIVLNLSDYTKIPIQKSLVKQVGNSLMLNGDNSKIINHHQQIFKIHFDCFPSVKRRRLVKQGMKVKSFSGREIARKIKPEAACSMAMHDEFVSKGHDLKKLEEMKLKDKLEPAFHAIMSLGFIPSQLLDQKNL